MKEFLLFARSTIDNFLNNPENKKFSPDSLEAYTYGILNEIFHCIKTKLVALESIENLDKQTEEYSKEYADWHNQVNLYLKTAFDGGLATISTQMPYMKQRILVSSGGFLFTATNTYDYRPTPYAESLNALVQNLNAKTALREKSNQDENARIEANKQAKAKPVINAQEIEELKRLIEEKRRAEEALEAERKQVELERSERMRIEKEIHEKAEAERRLREEKETKERLLEEAHKQTEATRQQTELLAAQLKLQEQQLKFEREKIELKKQKVKGLRIEKEKLNKTLADERAEKDKLNRTLAEEKQEKEKLNKTIADLREEVLNLTRLNQSRLNESMLEEAGGKEKSTTQAPQPVWLGLNNPLTADFEASMPKGPGQLAATIKERSVHKDPSRLFDDFKKWITSQQHKVLHFIYTNDLLKHPDAEILTQQLLENALQGKANQTIGLIQALSDTSFANAFKILVEELRLLPDDDNIITKDRSKKAQSMRVMRQNRLISVSQEFYENTLEGGKGKSTTSSRNTSPSRDIKYTAPKAGNS